MAAPYLYYINPFGISADDLPVVIPMTPAVDNSVSYFAGWTPPYEYNLLTNPAALPIPRAAMNQLIFDITNNLQEYQQYGTPQWITSIQNGGSPFAYPIYAKVYYLGIVYENQVAANTATPGTDTTWVAISGDVLGVPTGTMIDFGGVNPPVNYLLCDGSQVSRSTYSNLMKALAQIQTVTTTISAVVTGLTRAQETMYVGMTIESPNFPSGTVINSVDSDTQVTMNNAATISSSTTIQFFNWGNGDGSTTFNLPDRRRRVAIGAGSTATLVIGNISGQFGGTETNALTDPSQLPAHNHPGSTVNPGVTSVEGGGGAGPITFSNSGLLQNVTVASQGSSAPFSIMQPSSVCTICIKT
jgi:microcystin-dependent protein